MTKIKVFMAMLLLFSLKLYCCNCQIMENQTKECSFVNLTGLLLNNATGKKENDLGDIDLCKKTQDKRFVVMQAQIQMLGGQISIGLCGPAWCSLDDQKNATDALLKALNQTSIRTSFYFPDIENDIPWSFGSIFMVIILSLILGISCISTLYDICIVIKEKSRKEKEAVESANLPLLVPDNLEKEENLIAKRRTACERLLLCFSLKTNIERLFSPSEKSPLNIFNGLRVLSMFWVIWGHVQQFHFFGPILNVYDFAEFWKRFFLSLILQATMAVDIFFFLSGFLCTWLLYKEVNQKKIKSNFLMMYFHRLYRLWPLYLFLLFFAWKVVPMWNSGPVWKKFKDMYIDCADNCWTNILFLNNVIPWDSPGGCFGWAWQLANDMQFFIITPFLILAFCYRKLVGYIIPFVMLFGSWITIFIISWQYNISTSWINNNQGESYRLIYIKPYARIPAQLIGILAAFLYLQIQEEKEKNEYSKITGLINRLIKSRLCRISMYIVGVGLMMIALFLPQDAQINTDKWSKTGDCLFQTLQRSIFVFGLLLLVFPGLMGQGWGINKIFGADLWTPLARVTQGAYLVHPIIQCFYILGSKYSSFYQDWEYSLNFVSFAVVSYLFAIVLSVLFESPLQGIEKEFWRKKPHKKEVKDEVKQFLGIFEKKN